MMNSAARETKRGRFVLIGKDNASRCPGDEAPRFVLIGKVNANFTNTSVT